MCSVFRATASRSPPSRLLLRALRLAAPRTSQPSDPFPDKPLPNPPPSSIPAQLHAAVAEAVLKVPQAALEAAQKAAPKCVRVCCKPTARVQVTVAAPKFSCPAGKQMDLVGFACVGDAKLGYADCPAGMKSCLVSAWKRPLCATEAPVFGVDSCHAFELLSLAHKLPKVACP